MENEQARSRFMAEFVAEALEHLDVAEEALVRGEATVLDGAAQEEFMRAMHTIKGAAGYLALAPIQTLAHALEQAAQRAAGGPAASQERVAALFAGLDALRQLLARPDEPAQVPAALLDALETGGRPAAAAYDADAALREAFESVVRRQCDTLRTAIERLKRDPADPAARASYGGVLNALRAAAAYASRRDLETILVEAGPPADAVAAMAGVLLERLDALLAGNRTGPAVAQPVDPAMSSSASLAPAEPAAASPVHAHFVRVAAERIDKIVDQAGELVAMRHSLQRFIASLDCAGLGDGVCANGRALAFSLGRMVDELQRSTLDLRLIQLDAIFRRLPRVARDVAARTGKRVRFETHGTDTEIDKGVAEAITDPLLHMVRNAVDHGLEPADERVAAGKDPYGLVQVRPSREGNFVVITIEDDGRGISLETVRETAIARRIISREEAASLSTAATYGLLFRPGFSTANTVTEISGRGVGLDVVHANVGRLGGEVTVASEPGTFTRIAMRLPVCVSAQDVLLVEAAGERYAIPIDVVRKSLSVQASTVRRAGGHGVVVSDERLVPLLSLSALLGLGEAGDGATTREIVVLALRGRSCGLIVDAIGQRQQVTIRPLDACLASDGIAGAAVLADGGVALVLDPELLIAVE